MSEKKINKVQVGFFLFLVAMAIILNFFIFQPFLLVLFLSVTLAVLFYPVFDLLWSKFNYSGWGGDLSAFLTLIILLIVIMLPLTAFGILAFNEIRDLYFRLASGEIDLTALETGLINLEEYLQAAAPSFSIDFNVQDQISGLFDWVIRNTSLIFSNLANILIGFLFMILAFYYTLKEGRNLKRTIIAVSPLEEKYSRQILNKLRIAINTVIRESLLLAVIRLFAVAIAFSFFGIPNPILWSILGAVIAVIPGIGTAIVLIPAVIYLAIFGTLLNTLGLAIAGILLIIFIDNILGPKLIERGMKIHQFLILVSIVGGIMVMGPIGFFVGPILLSLMFALFHIYPMIMQNVLSFRNRPGLNNDQTE